MLIGPILLPANPVYNDPMEGENAAPAAESQKKRALRALGVLRLHHAHQKKLEAAKKRLAGEVHAALRKQGAPASDDAEWPALASAAEIVLTLDHDLQNQVLAKLPEEIREQMVERLYSFSSIPRLDGRSIQKLIRSVEPRTVAVSLIDAGDTIRNAITSNMSSRARTMLEEDIESLVGAGELSRRDLREARSLISSALYDLYESGQLGGGNEQD